MNTPRTLRSALALLRSAPRMLGELERSRLALDEAREELVKERRRLAQARKRNEARRKELDEEKKALEQREQRFRERRRRFKDKVRSYVLSTMPHRAVCAEIGVHEGEFSQQILDATSPERLHLIDSWEHLEEYESALFGGLAREGQTTLDERYGKVCAAFAKEIKTGRVEVHRDYSSSAAGRFEDSYFDWVYIDGNHLYEFVKQDLELYHPKVKPGGYIAGDDYGGRGWWGNGVQQAVDEFVRLRSELGLEVLNNQFVISVPEWE